MPLEKTSMNYIEIFNESTILICGYIMPAFTDFLDNPDIKNYSGFAIISMVLLNLLVNIMLIIKEKIHDLIKTIRKLKERIKAKLRGKNKLPQK